MYFEKYTTTLGNGEYRWRIRDANGEVFAQGRYYKTRAERDEAIDLLISNINVGTPIKNLDKLKE